MHIVTYTSSHNHPAPDLPSTANQFKESQNKTTQHLPNATLEVEDQEQKEEKKDPELTSISDQHANEDNFHYLQSPIGCSEEDFFKMDPEKIHNSIDHLLEDEPICYSQLKNFSTPKSEELDFFD